MEEKEKKEKEMVQQIIETAEKFKADFYSKRIITIENNKKSNREKEKVILSMFLSFKILNAQAFSFCDEIAYSILLVAFGEPREVLY